MEFCWYEMIINHDHEFIYCGLIAEFRVLNS